MRTDGERQATRAGAAREVRNRLRRTQERRLLYDRAMIDLRSATPPAWLDAVLSGFDHFLLDHAAAERKASAVALSLISHYPDREALVAVMMDIAREELEHFYQVYKRLRARGLTLSSQRRARAIRSWISAARPGSG